MDLDTLTLEVRKNQLTARFFGYLCLASLALSVVSLVSDFMQYQNLTGRTGSIAVEGETAAGTMAAGLSTSGGSRQTLLSNFQFILSVATLVMMLTWFHSSYRLLRFMEVKGLRFSPGWAVGAFFVPILNFWRPFVIARELWHGNSPEAQLPHPLKESPPLVTGWWVCWLGTNVLALVMLKFTLDMGSGTEELARLVLFLMVNEVLGALSMFLTFLMVNRISAAQARKAWEFDQKLRNHTISQP